VQTNSPTAKSAVEITVALVGMNRGFTPDHGIGLDPELAGSSGYGYFQESERGYSSPHRDRGKRQYDPQVRLADGGYSDWNASVSGAVNAHPCGDRPVQSQGFGMQSGGLGMVFP
jgi:hypothetical protein